jgi:hypothetical protein
VGDKRIREMDQPNCGFKLTTRLNHMQIFKITLLLYGYSKS